MNHMPSRRDMLTGGGALVVAFSFAGPIRQALAQVAAAGKPLALTEVDSFLSIDPKGSVTCYTGKVDLGTGITTALRQIVAEELDVPLDRVNLITGDTSLTPDQGTTWGSLTIQIGGMQIRNAAATARDALMGEAAQRLGVKTRGSHCRRRGHQRRRQARGLWRADRRQTVLAQARPPEARQGQGPEGLQGRRQIGPARRYPRQGDGQVHLHAGRSRARHAAWTRGASACPGRQARERRRRLRSKASPASSRWCARATSSGSWPRPNGPPSRQPATSRRRGRARKTCLNRRSCGSMSAPAKSPRTR